MASTTQILSPPSEADVRRGAKALAKFSGVWRVAVFGSVPRGEADQSSDIDYLVICSDIDYLTRNQLALDMQAAATKATGHDVDVVLTDTAEWTARTALASTFETSIEHHAVNIVLKQHKQTSAARQTITMATKAEQATAELVHMTTTLSAMRVQAAGIDPENEMRDAGRSDLFALERDARWMKTLQQAEMALEHGLSALLHVTGGKREGRITHELAQFRDAAPRGPIRDQVFEMLNPLRVSELSIKGNPKQAPNQKEFTVFRMAADYGPLTVHDGYVTADRVLLYMTAAVAVGELALRETAALDRPEHFAGEFETSLNHFEMRLTAVSRFVAGYEPASGKSTPRRNPTRSRPELDG